MALMDPVHDVADDLDELPRDPTIRELRRDALGHDALLFCGAFSLGALVYVVARAVRETGGQRSDYWSIGLSDGLVLCGLLAGELFLLWNNGYRQGVRGHSIGKHRAGVAVVDRVTGRPAGPLRGVARGLVVAILLDLALAAVPIGLPTVFRELTPDRWHVGGAAYLALLLILLPLALPSRRGVADRLTRTVVVPGEGPDATTSTSRRGALVVLDAVGVLGVLAVASTYVAFYWPLLWRFPGLS